MRGMADRLFPISNAKVQSFNRCRKQFWFRYVSGLPWPDSPMNEAGVIGAGVHRAMSVLTETDDVDIGISELDVYLRMPVHELAGPGTDAYQTAFELFSRGCTAYEELSETTETCRAELETEVKWPSGGIAVRARIDRADRVNAERFRVIDWKTGGYDNDVDTDLQLDISHLTLRTAWGLPNEATVEAVGWNLRLERKRVRELGRPDAVATMKKLRAIAKRMAESTEFEATPSGACSFCDWFSQCEEGQSREWAED